MGVFSVDCKCKLYSYTNNNKRCIYKVYTNKFFEGSWVKKGILLHPGVNGLTIEREGLTEILKIEAYQSFEDCFHKKFEKRRVTLYILND